MLKSDPDKTSHILYEIHRPDYDACHMHVQALDYCLRLASQRSQPVHLMVEEPMRLSYQVDKEYVIGQEFNVTNQYKNFTRYEHISAENMEIREASGVALYLLDLSALELTDDMAETRMQIGKLDTKLGRITIDDLLTELNHQESDHSEAFERNPVLAYSCTDKWGNITQLMSQFKKRTAEYRPGTSLFQIAKMRNCLGSLGSFVLARCLEDLTSDLFDIHILRSLLNYEGKNSIIVAGYQHADWTSQIMRNYHSASPVGSVGQKETTLVIKDFELLLRSLLNLSSKL